MSSHVQHSGDVTFPALCIQQMTLHCLLWATKTTTTECAQRRRERSELTGEIQPAACGNKGSRQRNREMHEMARPRSATKPPWARPLRTVPVRMSPVVNIGTTDKQGTTRKSTDGSETSGSSSGERSTRTVMMSPKMSTNFGRCGSQPPIRKEQ